MKVQRSRGSTASSRRSSTSCATLLRADAHDDTARFSAEDLSCTPRRWRCGERATLGGSEGRQCYPRAIGAGEWVDVATARLRLRLWGPSLRSPSWCVRLFRKGVRAPADHPRPSPGQGSGRDEAAEICTEIADRVILWASGKDAIVQWRGPESREGARQMGGRRAGSRRAVLPRVRLSLTRGGRQLSWPPCAPSRTRPGACSSRGGHAVPGSCPARVQGDAAGWVPNALPDCRP